MNKKLSTKSKDELRNLIEESVTNIPEDLKLQLDLKILEDLLFETITIDKAKGIIFKVPVWSGNFLKKIDLSQVDFTNVSWAILNSNPICSMNINSITIDNRVYEHISRIRKKIIEKQKNFQNKYITIYSGTNANIDLTKSYEALHKGVIDIRACDFSGIDFSKTDLSEATEVYLNAVNISGTNLVIPSNVELLAYDSDLEGINLLSRTINASDYFKYDIPRTLPKCSLKNTGTNIILFPKDFRDDDWKAELNKAMNEDWIGCYVNGKKVLSNEEKRNIAQGQRKIYEKMIDDVSSYISKEIELQTSFTKK